MTNSTTNQVTSSCVWGIGTSTVCSTCSWRTRVWVMIFGTWTMTSFQSCRADPLPELPLTRGNIWAYYQWEMWKVVVSKTLGIYRLKPHPFSFLPLHVPLASGATWHKFASKIIKRRYPNTTTISQGICWWKGDTMMKTTQTPRFAFHKEKPYVCFSWAKYDPRDIHGCHVYPAGMN